MGLNLKIPPNWGVSSFQMIYYSALVSTYVFYRSATVPTIEIRDGKYCAIQTSTAYWHSWNISTQTWGSQNTATGGTFPFDKTTLAEVDEIIHWTSQELYYNSELVSAVKVSPSDVFTLSELWIITEGINNNYPYITGIPIPSDTTFTEPYPTWMWRIDEFYNDGYPYLIGLRLPYVIPDDKYVDGHGLAVIWEHLLNLLEEKADLAYVDNAVAETALVNSTTETKTNQKWLDGKPIYRKLFEIPNANLTAGTTQITLGVDAETITNLHATIEYTASTSLINVNSYWCSDLVPTVSSQIIKIECVNGNLEILKQNDMSADYENLTITVEFTKSTD